MIGEALKSNSTLTKLWLGGDEKEEKKKKKDYTQKWRIEEEKGNVSDIMTMKMIYK